MDETPTHNSPPQPEPVGLSKDHPQHGEIERDRIDLADAATTSPSTMAAETTVASEAAPPPAPKSVDEGGTPVEGSALSKEELEQLTTDIVAAIKTVYDPEIPADIYELGLIYKIDVDDDRNVDVLMTLTAPGCPVAGEMPIWVENAVNAVPGVSAVMVELTFDPPWTMDRMSDEARLALNMF